jgi:predicted outer membrane repeat protein
MMRGLRVLLPAAGAGLLLAACGASAPGSAAGTAAGHGAVSAGASAAAQGSSAAATAAVRQSGAVRAGASARTQTSAAAEAGGGLPRNGNPDGHAYVPKAARAVSTSHPSHVIGSGTPTSCTSAKVVSAVAAGGIITFDCGPKPVTITMTATATVEHGSRTVLDGGGKVTLSGGGKIRILDMNTCPRHCWEQKGPQLIVQNMRFVDSYAPERETNTNNTTNDGGGAIYVQGGQLKVVNSAFINDRCYAYGPDLGGGAIRAYGMDMHKRVYLADDTFRDNKCSNGAALSGLYANFDVINSSFTGNDAIGWGQNPAQAGTKGGGSGGAIYTDGDAYNLIISGSVLRDNHAREGGGAIFFVVDNGHGALTIEHSSLSGNPSGQFENAPGIFDNVDQSDVQPTLIGSTDN